MGKKIGFVIPVANEEASIAAFLAAIAEELASLDDKAYVLYLVMDTYSRDRTRQIIEELSAADPRIRLVWFPESNGSVSCRLHGFKLALQEGCDYIIEMDSGFSHPPSLIPLIVARLDEEGTDVVFMSRFMRGGGVRNFPVYRRIVSWGGSLLANLWLGTRFSDATSGYQAFKAHVLRGLDLDGFLAKGGIYSTEMKYYCSDYPYAEVPFTYVGSTSAFRMKWIVEALKTLASLPANKRRVCRQRS